MGGNDTQGSLPASVRLAWWQSEPFRGTLAVLGVLLIGGGFCCLVFCIIAFHEANTLENRKEMIMRLARTNQGNFMVDGRNWTPAEANLAYDGLRSGVLEKYLLAVVLLTVTLGLVLGGIAFVLLSLVLRPSTRVVPEPST
jgi:hypothetical protein